MPKYIVPIPPDEFLKNQLHRQAMFYFDADAAGDLPLCAKIFSEYGNTWATQKAKPPTKSSFTGSWNKWPACAARMVHLHRIGRHDADLERLIVDYCYGQLAGDLGWWGKEFFSETYSLVLSVYVHLHDWALREHRTTVANWTGRLARVNGLMLRLHAIRGVHPRSELEPFLLAPKLRTPAGREGGESLSERLRTSSEIVFRLTEGGPASWTERNINPNTTPIMGCSAKMSGETLRFQDLIPYPDPYRGGGGKKLGTCRAGRVKDSIVATVEGAVPPTGIEVESPVSIAAPPGLELFEVRIGREGVALSTGCSG